MKKYLYLLSTVSAALIIGCGDNSSVSDQQFSYDTTSIFGYSKEITYKNYVVNAVDDPIVGATVSATNCETYEDLGNGQYMLKKCIGKPIYIEIKNGIIYTKDKNGTDINVSQDFPLLLNVSQSGKDDNFVVTPLTTILANANDENISALAQKLGVSEDDLYNATNDNVKNILPKINAVLVASAAQGAITNKVKFLDVVREAIIDDNSSNGDINISNVIDVVKKKSIDDPNFFGLVIINNNIDNEDPLQSLSQMQNAQNVTFYGLVFDNVINDANITIKDLDSNITYSDINATSDNNGAWTISIDENETEGSLYYTIMNEEHLLQLIATKEDGNKTIKLTSTVTTTRLREMLNDGTKIISPTKDNSLIVSNITTAQDAMLDKKGALNSKSYEGNLSDLRVYNQDRVIKVAAIIKAVVDNNSSTSKDYNNTYDLAKDSISTDNNGVITDVNTSIVEANISEIEQNITDNTILSSQLNSVADNDKNNSFQQVSENTGYTFYRLLAYYKENQPKTDDNFVREYTKIIVYPSYYYTKTCLLEGNSTDDWNCSEVKEINNSSNFTLGHYEISTGSETIKYSLDFNDSFYVEDLNKSYNYYGVIKSDINLTSGTISTEPMILVDSYDVVDAFRRMPSEDTSEFNDLQDIVKDYNTRREVNFALNRWIKDNFINSVQDYFDNNQTNQ